jgi:hypothetical protein
MEVLGLVVAFGTSTVRPAHPMPALPLPVAISGYVRYGGIWKSCQRQFLLATVYRALILSVFVHIHSPKRLTPCVPVQTRLK